MERQRGERARRHQQEMAPVAHERFDRGHERVVEVMRLAEIEQHRLAPRDRVVEFTHVEAAAECGDPGRKLLRPSAMVRHAKPSRVSANT